MSRRKAPDAKPPLLRVGPGLLLALLAVALIWNRMPRQPGPPPASKPEVIREETPRGAPSAPDPEWLLTKSRALGLRAEQEARLSALVERWRRDTRELRGQMEAAQADFESAMRAGEGRPAGIDEIRGRAAPITELSRQMADARRAWWAEASGVLSARQREQAETMWARRFDAQKRDEESR